MLVLSRNLNEKIMIGDNIVVTIVSVDGGKVRLGIEAPTDISVHRKEVYETVKYEKWYDAVSDILKSNTGMGCDCLPDFPSRESYNKGMTPKEGAEACLKYSNISFELSK